MTPKELHPSSTGQRLRVARKSANLTQACAAGSAGIARTTLVAIEQGKRPIRTRELQCLANVYGVSVNRILRRESAFVKLAPRFRSLYSSPDRARDSAVATLEVLVRAEVELENLLGVDHCHRYPPERPILPGDPRAQAEQDALELRHWLGIGQGPIQEFEGLLAFELGVRVYVQSLDAGISGLLAFDETHGACMLLNANHPKSRRNYTAAHELGHLLSSRSKPLVMRSDLLGNSREERYADMFARAFLTPARSVKEIFQSITTGATHFTRRHAVLMAHRFGVSREAMVRRLEELCLVQVGSWTWFQQHGGITNIMEQRVLGEAAPQLSQRDCPTPVIANRLSTLVAAAWRNQLLSEGQLADLLQVDRIALRIQIDEVLDEVDADAILELPEQYI